MHDYMYLYRHGLLPCEQWSEHWDVFVSAYNSSERVNYVFNKISAARKLWLVHEEYGFDKGELPFDNPFLCKAMDETSILDFWNQRIKLGDNANEKICIDATGFMRPHLLFLLHLMVAKGIKKFDVLYSEPMYYKNKDKTAFSGKHVNQIRQIVGFEGISDSSGNSDVLVIGAGYETHLIEEIAEDKDRARKVVILGLPSLRADMYQQNAWRTWLAEDALDGAKSQRWFAPASDPFATATILSERIYRERSTENIRHLYLSPLATKAQAIGFALFYLTECQGSNTSIIFPFTMDYERETSIGFSRAWLHTLEF